ncbi:cell wall hydrolase [Caulobacter sp. KR2-114]|uniref:cell wall hydrolase n=1 Tax=Caulobacter sp. KR2-114 TaxID=3400912 RepID=UPI003C03E440
MSLLPQSRAQARALAGAALVAGGLGGVLAGAYWAGAHTEVSLTQARVRRLADAAAAGFSDVALQRATSGMGPGALAAAQRRDPVLRQAEAAADTDHTVQERAAALLAARAVARVDGTPPAPPPGAERPRLMLLRGPVAEPFHSDGALESSRDLDCLTAAVYYETGSDVAAGQAAVAQVVLNRVRHPAFPKSVCGVVFQGAASGRCQFSFVCDGAMRRPKSPAMWENARKVAARALGGYVMPEAGEAVSFHAAYLGRLWPSMQRVGQIGAHVFYRFGHGGSGFDNGVYALERKAPDGVPAPSAPATPADRPVYAEASAGSGEGRLAVITAAPVLMAQSLGGQPAAAPAAAPARPAPAPARTAPETTPKAPAALAASGAAS